MFGWRKLQKGWIDRSKSKSLPPVLLHLLFWHMCPHWHCSRCCCACCRVWCKNVTQMVPEMIGKEILFFSCRNICEMFLQFLAGLFICPIVPAAAPVLEPHIKRSSFEKEMWLVYMWCLKPFFNPDPRTSSRTHIHTFLQTKRETWSWKTTVFFSSAVKHDPHFT